MSVDPSPVGNVYDKYSSQHPLERVMVDHFLATLDNAICMLDLEGMSTALEVGCGEGVISDRLSRLAPHLSVVAFDIGTKCVLQAMDNTKHVQFCVADACLMPFRTGEFDLVVALEVLEHLSEPEKALAEMRRVSRSHLVVSVPNEPLWRILNILRGAYRDDWGNTPGHIQHWGTGAFRCLLERHVHVVRMWRPLPWIMALCESPDLR